MTKDVAVYPPNSDKPEMMSLANARDMVNGAGWTWRPNDVSHTPAASTPYVNVQADEPGVEDILKAGAVQDRPKPGAADSADTSSDAGDDEGEGDEPAKEAAPAKTAAKPAGTKRPARPAKK